MRTIDGSMGEGGGQILRTALSLALVEGAPVRVENIRAGRRKGGLLKQHLACVRAAVQISGGAAEGDELGSTAVEFAPRALQGGRHRFAIGSAGSTMLVLQTLLPALLRAGQPTELTLEGGTHNPLAPTFDFLDRVFVPLLRRMGAQVELSLVRPGFQPAGGGRVEVRVTPSPLRPLVLLERGAPVRRRAYAIISALPGDVAERELARVREVLGWLGTECTIRGIKAPIGPGNVLWSELESAHVTEAFVAFGERGRPAEQVADDLCAQVADYLASDAPVGEHLADQLLLPLALAGGGAFRAVRLSSHARTQLALIPRFLRCAFEVTEEASGAARVEVRSL